ncbi:MAG: hypothetical protein AB7S75_08205 [Desulfococcaceae bacterium]
MSEQEKKKILIAEKDGTFTQGMSEYAVRLAERLGYGIFALHVGEKPCDDFRKKAEAAAVSLRKKAVQSKISFEHAVKFGDLGTAVKQICHEIRRIELVVTESENSREEIAGEVSIPVFGFIFNRKQGGKIMDDKGKKRPVGKTVGYGLISAALYAAVFSNADTVMQYFTKGGVYAALPIVTVFVFSFAHAAFAGSLWSLLGIEAVKKDSLAVQKTVQKKKAARKRPRAYAYVNPFHRM